MHMDAEDRTNRLIGALDGLAYLFGSQPPGLPISGENTAYLLSLLADEAKALVPRTGPPRPVND